MQCKRRNLLKNASAALAGASLIDSIRSRVVADQSIKVGIITEPPGMHLTSYLKTLSTCQEVEQVAIADETGQTFEMVKQGLGARSTNLLTFLDYRKMVQVVRPKLVLISLEAHRTPYSIEVALEGNCHVLAEKPACARLTDFERVVRIADSKNLHLMLALATRLSPPSIKARELVQAGFLGKPYGTSMHWVADQRRLTRPLFHQSWLASKARAGGGKLIFHGIHYLDLIQFITGDRITQVCGFSRNVGGQPIETEDAAVVALQFKGGMVGTLNAGYYLDRGYDNLVVLWGSEGWLRFDQPNGTPLEWYSTHRDAPKGIQSFTYSNEPKNYDLMFRNAVNVSRGIERPFVTAADCLHVLKVIFSAYRAAETGSAQTVG